jgi:GT2 family glycosyltransferase
MPPRNSRPQHPGHLVTAVLVSHDGAQWLPGCLAALAAQTRPPQRVIAVDTGSADDSPAQLAAILGESAVVHLPRNVGLGTAVQAGLDAFRGAPAPLDADGSLTEWIWVLHDDCAPQPGALGELLACAADSPSVAVWGPKTVSWDGRRLREVGLTVDSSGRPQTGLEARELDQGQHDDVGDVLAVGTAGMLVRRDTWDALGGLDPRWPLFGDDVDFGWRLAAAGERVRVAPRAVVRHAAALQTGRRPADAVRGRPGAVARRHGLQVVLANTAAALVPLLLLRYVVEGAARALALFVLARRPRAALDEMSGLAGALRHPRLVVAARRTRAGRTAGHSDVRALLAPASWRWRRLGDASAEVFAGRAAVDDRRRRRAPVETGPVSAEAEAMHLDDAGLLAGVLRRPGVLLTVALTTVGLVASRHLLGGVLHGGRLLPPPGGAADLWSTYRAGWHPVGLGSAADAPPSLALLGALSWLLLGKAWLAVDLLMLGAAPLAGLSAYVAAGALTRSARLRIWAAVTYAVLPALTGAVAGGRLDVVAAVIVLPLLVRSVAVAFDLERRGWHRAVGAGLMLAVVSAFAPGVWILAAAAFVVLPVIRARAALRSMATAAVVLAVPALVLLPWTVTVVGHPRLLLAGSGLPDVLATRRPLGSADVLLLHPGGPAQPPIWLLGPLVAAMLAGLLRAWQARAARVGLSLFVVGTGAALLVARLSGADAADPSVRYWTGVPLAVAAVGALIGGLVAADRSRDALRKYSFGWRQPVVALMTIAAVVGTTGAAAAWLVRGADRPLTDRSPQLLPVFAAAEVGRPTSPRVLALRSTRGIVHYAVVRDARGPVIGDADVERTGGSVAAEDRLAQTVREAVAGQATAVPRLVEFGVSMLVVPRSEAAALSGLASVDGLSQVPTNDAVVWRTGAATGELVVLDPTTASAVTAGADLPAAATPQPLAASGGAARVSVAAGPAGRLLVLAEPASRHWRATIDGHPLTGARAYGWAQAWTLPASGGRLEVGRVAVHRGWWLAGELALTIVALLLALPTWRRADSGGDA